MQAVIQFPSQLNGNIGEQVRPAYIPHEKGISHEDPDRAFGSGPVCDHIAEMLRGMPGRFQHLQDHIFQLNGIPF